MLEARPDFTSIYALYGLGGIGKTQIAIEYAYLHKEEFDIICWLRADDYQTLVSSYVQLAANPIFESFINLNIQDEKDYEIIANSIRLWFENTVEQSWLLIFDNADKLKEVIHPQEIQASEQISDD